MKTYIIYTKIGSFEINANDKKDADFKGRFNCRQTSNKFLSSRLKK